MINNLPSYADDYKYIVYRVVDNKKWFWGAYNDFAQAMQVCVAINGYIK